MNKKKNNKKILKALAQIEQISNYQQKRINTIARDNGRVFQVLKDAVMVMESYLIEIQEELR
jgi:hypothetical protein